MASFFNPLGHSVLFTDPERLTLIPTWHEHIPFAMCLVDLLRPEVFVELGTLYGDSYCAFCQAVQALGTRTRCYAVDTWAGDEHAGFQFLDALADLRLHHDSRYASFSTLVQSTFDEARKYFQDGTVDLLHIDGCHSYSAVKHDFETWRPKLSQRGIVLFHDTNVLERDFGVRQFWDEIRSGFPHFEFTHGCGLGVLAPERVDSPELQSLFEARPDETAVIRSLFYTLGNRLTIKKQLEVLSMDCEAIKTEARMSAGKALSLENEKAQAEQKAELLFRQVSEITRSRAWGMVSAFWRIRSIFSKR